MARPRPAAACCLLILFLLGGCAPQAPEPLVMPDEFVPGNAIVVRADRAWTDSGYSARAGEPLTIVARGRAGITKLGRAEGDEQVDVGPEGTFFYADALQHQTFPLPAAGRGPAPCFCLIGRIGHGLPFFIGAGRSWVPQETGRLYLGINDYDIAGNCGEFYAVVTRPPEVQPASFRTDVPLDACEGTPTAQGCVVVIYVDGLRPDVVEEMAAMGHVPHLKRHFVDGGAMLRNAFTVFPSDTITANGTMWTGCFSDRHGLKGQVRFSRRRRQSDSYLSPMGSNRSTRLLNPQGIDRVLIDTGAAAREMLAGYEAGERFRMSQTSGTPAVFDYLRACGDDWATGALPIMTDSPPPMWTRNMTQFLPYFRAHEAWKYLDDANATYAVRHLLRNPQPVTIVWLPETDSVSHKECRGQFGSTRRAIARADRLVGDVVAELKAQGRLEQTFLMLVSDHGHLGGQFGYLERYDLTNELLFDPRTVDEQGRWIGGGLGLSVRQHRFTNMHEGDSPKQFVFVDCDSDGAARLYFPKGRYRSEDWSGPNSPADLLAYPVSRRHRPVNLPLTIASACRRDADGQVCHPIDLVLMKLTENSILITTCDRGQAVIERQKNDAGLWVYRYTPVHCVEPTPVGEVRWKAFPQPAVDPLGLACRTRPGFLEQYHDETVWLWATATTDYPDSVVALTRHMLWQEHLREQEREYAPDLVATARRGWVIGLQNSPGSAHGYPLDESMRATWYLSGPGIRAGARIDAPCRLADLTPTILELSGTPFDPQQMDGQPLRTIYEEVPNPEGADAEIQLVSTTPQPLPERPLYWEEVDLHAWQPLEYRPGAVYADLPVTINRPNSGWDLNSIAYNAMAISDWSVLRLADDAMSAAIPGRTQVTETVIGLETKAAHSGKPWMGQAAEAAYLPEVALTDYSLTSTGNFLRADKAVDWVQDREAALDRALARPFGAGSILGSGHTNKAIDSVQAGFWDVYRFGQRLAAEIIDETVINGLENTVDNTVNSLRKTPAEVRVNSRTPHP